MVFELTSIAKTILSTKPWERDIEYGFKGGLERIAPEHIDSAKITVLPDRRYGFIEPINKSVEDYFSDPNIDETLIEVVRKASDSSKCLAKYMNTGFLIWDKFTW
ncbi:hypothetical protein NZD89_28800 (plasmid) [Alicyclobacillus fastidiosus]|uniref:Uncharacterized protein n=1 Tax=Alicyclobacillus fastidiosus TaxID=392011 RepID=A0ABY6ZRS9_9BACL|nr:hypothetical protein [Alicyclobacillus fastidiosus]WAH44856.1 hypothetical protein NZD89_28800 [Alicyclobacillus fastidiosus]